MKITCVDENHLCICLPGRICLPPVRAAYPRKDLLGQTCLGRICRVRLTASVGSAQSYLPRSKLLGQNCQSAYEAVTSAGSDLPRQLFPGKSCSLGSFDRADVSPGRVKAATSGNGPRRARDRPGGHPGPPGGPRASWGRLGPFLAIVARRPRAPSPVRAPWPPGEAPRTECLRTKGMDLGLPPPCVLLRYTAYPGRGSPEGPQGP